jgi:PAS domain S-box-containing protein
MTLGEIASRSVGALINFAGAVESLPDAVVVLDRSGALVLVNDQAQRLFGRSRPELLGRTLPSLLPGSEDVDQPGSRPPADLVRPDGTTVPVELRLGPLELDGTAFVCVTLREVPARIRAGTLQLRLASLVDSAQNAIISAGVDGRVESWNRAAERLFGYTEAEALGQPAAFLKPPELVGQSGAKMDKVRSGALVPASDTVRRHKDGRNIEVSITHSAMRDPDGTLIGTSIVVRDLTEQRRSEAVRFRLASIIQHSGAAIIGYDLETLITSWNAAAEDLYGYTAAEAIGRPGAFLVPDGPEQDTSAVQEQLDRGGVIAPYDALRQRKDGSLVDVSISLSFIRDATGAKVGYSAFVYDITDRKRSERELRAAHEATLIASREYESFAYAVAHDLRAPLRAIDGFVYLGREAYEAGRPAEARAHLERASGNARHMGRLIDGLLRLAALSRQSLARTSVDLSALATRALARLQDETPSREVEAVVQPGLTTTGDRDLLGIVLTNLIDNAWKFTRHRSPARIEVGREGGHYFVKDNGAGFDMEHYDKLFGMFQRLHQQAEFEGTGIGLATTQRIIRRHAGQIWAEGVVDQGSTFCFTLEPEPAGPD